MSVRWRCRIHISVKIPIVGYIHSVARICWMFHPTIKAFTPINAFPKAVDPSSYAPALGFFPKDKQASKALDV